MSPTLKRATVAVLALALGGCVALLRICGGGCDQAVYPPARAASPAPSPMPTISPIRPWKG